MQEIDFVFPYVDNSDPIWRKSYKDYCEKNGLKDKAREIDGERFRNCSFLRYILRSVETNASFIHNIYIIVSNIEQIPTWIDTKKIKIVLHKDIIPEEYLPIFNSEAIEMFLGNIEGLSEHFLYGNDDFLFLNKCAPEDFFDFKNGKIRVKINKFDKNKKDPFTVTCRNVAMWAAELAKVTDASSNIRPEHDMSPMLRSEVLKVQELLIEHKKNFIPHAFRTEGDYNQYLYTMYLYFKGRVEEERVKYKYTELKNNKIDELKELILNSDYQTLTINDTGPNIFNIKFLPLIYKTLDKKFPNKSKYEV